MTEYDIEELKEMTVDRYIEFRDSENEEDNDIASDALANISLYLYSNVDMVDDLDIDDSEIEDGKYKAFLCFEVTCEDYPIIQCDADDFIESTIHGSFEDMIEIEVTPKMTFMEIAEKMKEEIEAQAEREIEHAGEEACEEYHEHHSSHRSYWYTR